MTASKQARLPLSAEVQPKLNSTDTYFVGVQNIALARIDVQAPGGPRRVLLNLFGTRDIDRLIEALQTARAALVAQQEELHQYLAEHPESVLPAVLP